MSQRYSELMTLLEHALDNEDYELAVIIETELANLEG